MFLKYYSENEGKEAFTYMGGWYVNLCNLFEEKFGNIYKIKATRTL